MQNFKQRKNAVLLAAMVLLLTFLPLFSGCTSISDTGASGQEQTSQKKAGNGQELKVTFLDVGQGDSTFIELPDNRCMLIDAAESEYSQEILSYIQNEGYEKIDYLVATHPHSDHIGGMREILENLDIGSVYMPKVQTNTQVFEKLLIAIKERGLKIQTAKAGIEILSEGALDIQIVAPAGDDYSDLNNYSAVVRLTYGDDSFLFMGDAEKPSENDITQNIQADVLKVGHHGSEYSSGETFLKKVHPDYAVISCGEDNKYGHPDQETLQKLKEIHAKIFRTDRQGNIIMTSSGNGISADCRSEQQSDSQNKKAIKKSSAAQKDKYVYVTKSGSKYHTKDCYMLKSSSRSLTEKEARKEGYEPCGICSP